MVAGVNGVNLTLLSNVDDKFNRDSELKVFDDTKSGVKGLVDAGISEIPRIFYRPPEEDDSVNIPSETQIRIPVIDLKGFNKDPFKRKEIVERIKEASEEWGFFQLINHGIPVSVLEETKDAVRRFHEQDTELKKQYYTRDQTKPFIYNSNLQLYTVAITDWRDSYITAPNPPNPEIWPEICRDAMVEYSKRVMELGTTLLELLSEALGLNPNHLNNIDCNEGLVIAGHYYPACPQPDLTAGTSKHKDNGSLTVLLQDNVGGLQFRYRKKWANLSPVAGALVVNMGDFMQLITNDRFKSVEHRVVGNREAARVSVAAFFMAMSLGTGKLYGPIKELLSEENGVKYRETTAREFHLQYKEDGSKTSALQHFKV